MENHNSSGVAHSDGIKIGWAEEEITPWGPVLMAGLFHARLSEAIDSPLTVTALAMEQGGEQVVFVSCDLIQISADLQHAVLTDLRQAIDAKEVVDLDPAKVVMHATHTHTAPIINSRHSQVALLQDGRLPASVETIDIQAYIAFAACRIARVVMKAWTSRESGGIAYGQGYAAIGFNRRWVDRQGKAIMYGSKEAQKRQYEAARLPSGDKSHHQIDPALADIFRHIEGGEDHSIQVMATYGSQGGLSGLLVNVPCPAQEREDEFVISADWWHETRNELRKRYGQGQDLFILAQCSAAGDLSPHLLMGQAAHDRMLTLKGRSPGEEIAWRIADALDDILPHIDKDIFRHPAMEHRIATVALEANRLSEEVCEAASVEMVHWKEAYLEELRALSDHPELCNGPRWYVDITYKYGRMMAQQRVIDRYERQKEHPTVSATMHVIRIGDLAFATQPFEVYLDYGLQIKLRSPATQTFLVQLAGSGAYLPSPRSVQGGGYGSSPANNPVGPEGGQQLADYTVQAIRSMMATI